MDDEDPRMTNPPEFGLLFKQMKKFDQPDAEVDEYVLTQAVEGTASYFVNAFLAEGVPVKVLSKNQALNRYLANPNSNKIEMRSAPGYPYCFAKGVKGKSPFLAYDDDEGKICFGKNEYGRALSEDVDRLIDSARNGQRTGSAFVCSLKAENVERSKVYGKDPKTRMFMMVDLALQIAIRQYTHTLAAGFVSTRFRLPPQPGLSPLNGDWHRLACRLMKHSPYGIEVDFKGWDSTIPPQFMAAVARVLNIMDERLNENWKPENSIIRTTLLSHLVKPLFIVGTQVYQVPRGQPSGEPNTAVTNSIVNCLLTYYVWHKILEAQDLVPSFERFLFEIDQVNLGDDLLQSVISEALPHYNGHMLAEEFARIGMTAVNPNDKTKPIDKFVNVADATFVSRKFLYRDGHWHGPLKWISMQKMTTWMAGHKGKVNCWEVLPKLTIIEPNLIQSSAANTTFEMVDYGPEMYYWWKKHVENVSKKLRIPLVIPSYESIVVMQGVYRNTRAVPPPSPGDGPPQWYLDVWGSSQTAPKQSDRFCENTNSEECQIKLNQPILENPIKEQPLHPTPSPSILSHSRKHQGSTQSSPQLPQAQSTTSQYFCTPNGSSKKPSFGREVSALEQCSTHVRYTPSLLLSSTNTSLDPTTSGQAGSASQLLLPPITSRQANSCSSDSLPKSHPKKSLASLWPVTTASASLTPEQKHQSEKPLSTKSALCTIASTKPLPTIKENTSWITSEVTFASLLQPNSSLNQTQSEKLTLKSTPISHPISKQTKSLPDTSAPALTRKAKRSKRSTAWREASQTSSATSARRLQASQSLQKALKTHTSRQTEFITQSILKETISLAPSQLSHKPQDPPLTTGSLPPLPLTKRVRFLEVPRKPTKSTTGRVRTRTLNSSTMTRLMNSSMEPYQNGNTNFMKDFFASLPHFLQQLLTRLRLAITALCSPLPAQTPSRFEAEFQEAEALLQQCQKLVFSLLDSQVQDLTTKTQ
nr:MAG: RNA-dependent RNA polymerase [Riboviria sp.]